MKTLWLDGIEFLGKLSMLINNFICRLGLEFFFSKWIKFLKEFAIEYAYNKG